MDGSFRIVIRSSCFAALVWLFLGLACPITVDAGTLEGDDASGLPAVYSGRASSTEIQRALAMEIDESSILGADQDLAPTKNPVTGWYRQDGTWFYGLGDGSNKTGWLFEGDKRYWLDPMHDGACASGVVEIDGSLYHFDAKDGCAMSTGLCSEQGRAYYADPNTGKLRSGWIFAEGQWYRFDASLGNAAVTGWYDEGGCRYHLDPTGVMARGWALLDGSWYYFNRSGVMQHGWLWIGQRWYYLDDDGSMQTGWLDESGARYYLDASGAMRTGWAFLGSEWYCFNGSGAMRRGWYQEGGAWYLLMGDGHMARGSVLHEGRWSGFNDSGHWLGYASNCWIDAEDGWYYADGSGHSVLGWKSIGSDLYYLDPLARGRMTTGLFEVDGNGYYARPSGSLVVNAWVSLPSRIERFADSRGCLSSLYRKDGLIYSGDGSPLSGWVALGQQRIYVDPTTRRQGHGWMSLDGAWYFLDRRSGVLRTGWIFDDAWYYSDESGVMQTGWQRIDSNWYYLSPGDGGRMAKGEIFDGSHWYYLDAWSGEMRTGWRYVQGAEKWAYYDSHAGGARKNSSGMIGDRYCRIDSQTGALYPVTSPMGQRVAQEAYRCDAYGYAGGWCQAWVSAVCGRAGASGASRPCAWAAAQDWIVSRDRGGMPVGATVYEKSAHGSHGWSGGVYYPDYGHVGIYVGDGKVISLRREGIKIDPVELWTDGDRWLGWGWNGGVALV